MRGPARGGRDVGDGYATYPMLRRKTAISGEGVSAPGGVWLHHMPD